MAILLVAVFLAGAVFAAFFKQYYVPSTGYYEGELIITPETINWNNVTRNNPVTRSINLTNTGPPIATLNMTYGNASSNLYDYAVTWDAEGMSLATGYYITANLTLTVYDADEGSFSIDVTIRSEQT